MAGDVSAIINLSGLVTFFRDDPNCIAKGETKYNANFVLEVRLHDYDIFSSVRSSFKDKSYKTKLNIDGKGSIKSATCDCPRGNWICSHMAATAIYVNKKGFSKTDLPNSWIKRPKKQAKQEEVKTMEDYFPSSNPTYKATPRPFTIKDREAFFRDLSKTDVDCPFRWLLSPEVEKPIEPIAPPLIEDLLPHFAHSKEEFLSRARVTPEQQIWVAEKTKEQRKSQYWGLYRRLRLTGSNFGTVLKAIDRNQLKGRPFPPSLFKSLKGEYNLQKKDAIIWGQMHEDTALKEYVVKTGFQVVPTGLHLYPCGFLGCTPDGIVYAPGMEETHGALEIKCPYVHREHTIREMIEIEKGKNPKKNLNHFFLDENLQLNRSHDYWHQVQAEIVALETHWAHFVVWTTKDILVILIYKDDAWAEENLPKLKSFYLQQLLPVCFTTEK